MVHHDKNALQNSLFCLTWQERLVSVVIWKLKVATVTKSEIAKIVFVRSRIRKIYKVNYFRKLFFLTVVPAIIHKIFETNSSFHVK